MTGKLLENFTACRTSVLSAWLSLHGSLETGDDSKNETGTRCFSPNLSSRWENDDKNDTGGGATKEHDHDPIVDSII